MYLGSFILKSINKMLETGFKQYQYFIFLQYHKSGFWQSEWMGLWDFQQIVYLAQPGNITFAPWISSFLSSHCSYDPLWTRVWCGSVFVYLCICVFVYLCFCVCLEESNWRNNLVRIFSPNSPKLLPTGPSGQGCHQIVGCRHYLLLKTCSPSTFSVFLPITV